MSRPHAFTTMTSWPFPFEQFEPVLAIDSIVDVITEESRSSGT